MPKPIRINAIIRNRNSIMSTEISLEDYGDQLSPKRFAAEFFAESNDGAWKSLGYVLQPLRRWHGKDGTPMSWKGGDEAQFQAEVRHVAIILCAEEKGKRLCQSILGHTEAKPWDTFTISWYTGTTPNGEREAVDLMDGPEHLV